MSETSDIYRGNLDKILAFEQVVGAAEQTELPVKHYFAPGVYVRECFIPAGVCFTGRVHKHPHIAMITMGDVAFASTTDEPMRAQAPYTFHTPAGTKRAGIAITDTVFATVHAIPPELEGDVEAVEEYLVAATPEDFVAFVEAQEGLCLLQP